MTEPEVAKRLRLYEGAVMGQRSKQDGTWPINPNITAREAIELANWVKYLRDQADGRTALPADRR